MPVLAGIVDPDCTKKPIKGRVPDSRVTLHPVLDGILDPDFIKKTI